MKKGIPLAVSIFLIVPLVLTGCTKEVIKEIPPSEVTLEVLNPIAFMKKDRIVPVPRPTDLNNKKIVLYWNHKVNSNIAVDQVKVQLAKLYPDSTFAIVEGSAWAPEPGFYDAVLTEEPDVVISSTGD